MRALAGLYEAILRAWRAGDAPELNPRNRRLLRLAAARIGWY